MAHGRRPSSLCGAAIIIAGRMHDIVVNYNIFFFKYNILLIKILKNYIHLII